jgi:hypothetical protein
MGLIRRAPVMFVSDDAPSFALEPGELGLRLRACVSACLRVCVSACLRVSVCHSTKVCVCVHVSP